MHARLRLRPIAAALCFGAALAGTAQAGPAEDELWACTAELMRQVPSWRAMRDARIEMQQKGFRVISKEQEGYLDQRGRTVIAYGFQITGDNKAHSIRCTEDMFRAAAPAAAPGARFAQPAESFAQPAARFAQPLGGQFGQAGAQPAQPAGRRVKARKTKRAKPTSVAAQPASPTAAAQ
jgi:hypothetical protein